MMQIVYAAQTSLEELLQRRDDEQPDVQQVVAGVLADVRSRGDEALLDYTEKFDGVRPASLWVTPQEMEEAKAQAGPEFLQVLHNAAANIRRFHEKQERNGYMDADTPGVIMGQRILPLSRVGIYVPGGTAPLPSSVLMNAIPAHIAGVGEIIMSTPPRKDGSIDPGILAAASVAGVSRIAKMGGAQAVAAMAYGTQTIPRVDKIVGPGNIYVATAKKLVYGQVDIDMIAGPSDILVLADDTAAAACVAADMLGQAEHDPNAAAILVTTSAALAKQVVQELEVQLPKLSRKEIAAKSLQANGRIIVAEDMKSAVEIANGFAPEHLEICTADPFALLPEIQNAGSVFLGHNTPEALGDYFAGPNHTLPTAGTARFYSPLSVDDFVKRSNYLYYTRDALHNVAEQVQMFALHEQLDAHANSVKIRMQ